MTAYNIVRFKVKPGKEKAFEDAHRDLPRWAGLQEAALVKTGEHSYCVIMKWENFERIVAARPAMIGVLDNFRSMLDDLGGGLGVTDPVSGTAVVEL